MRTVPLPVAAATAATSHCHVRRAAGPRGRIALTCSSAPGSPIPHVFAWKVGVDDMQPPEGLPDEPSQVLPPAPGTGRPGGALQAGRLGLAFGVAAIAAAVLLDANHVRNLTRDPAPYLSGAAFLLLLLG